MYLVIGIVPLVIGILLLICAGKKSNSIRRTAIILMVLGILLIGVSLGMLFLVMSGRVILPLN